MKRISPAGNPILTKRQITALLCYYPYKKPSLREVAERLGVGSALAARHHVYELIRKGYMVHTGYTKRRCYRMTDKGRQWCRAYRRKNRRLKRSRKNELLRQRNRYIYHERQKGQTWGRIVYLLARASRSWPRLRSAGRVREWAQRYAERNGLPAPIALVHPKKKPRRIKQVR